MSRVGNKLIELKDGVTVEVKEGNLVTVKGPKGEITQQLSPKMTITVEGNHVKVARPSDSIENKTLHGTTRALLHNMVEGVTHEFTKSSPHHCCASLYSTQLHQHSLPRLELVIQKNLLSCTILGWTWPITETFN